MTKEYDGSGMVACEVNLIGGEGYIFTYASLSEALAARQEEWDPSSKLSLTFFATELAGEVGEACNCVKKLERERLGLKGSRSSLEALGEELSDVVMCAHNLAKESGIDLNKAIVSKFNATSKKLGFKTRLKE